MLILILIDVQYSQKAVVSFEKGLNGQNHSSSGSHHPVKNSPHPLLLYRKPWTWVQEICLKRIEQGVYHNLLHEIHVSDRESYFR